MSTPASPRKRGVKKASVAHLAAKDLSASFSAPEPKLFVNRELSLLQFQRRVLEEAQDPTNPLLERVKFLSIVGSNLDEFFMVRVAGLKEQMHAGVIEVGADTLPPAEQLEAIRYEVTTLMEEARLCLETELIPKLHEAGIHIQKYEELTAEQKTAADRYFEATVYPILTPLALDPGRPFPHISNLSLNLAVLIEDAKGVERFARIKVPDTIPQLIPLPAPLPLRKNGPRRQIYLVWIEEVIAANLEALFPGMRIREAHPFHVTRDADVEIQELEAADLLETIEDSLRQRRFGIVVRLKVNKAMPPHLLDLLCSNLEILRSDVYAVNGPLGLSRLMRLYTTVDRPDLKDPPFTPAIPKELDASRPGADLFAAIRNQDFLLHHPFDSFQPVVDFLRRAAQDPDVLAIKMTLYRVGRNSPVVDALLEANENGKQVAVLVELKARFDEESNIEWARALEKEGVHVVYGLVGLKIHCKVALVVRREGELIRRYVHMATGNYNAVTAALYTDLGLFTTDVDIGADTSDLFNYLTGYSAKEDYRKIFVAPINLRERFSALIEREIEHKRRGRPARLILKMNALVDPQMIRLLYEASRAGVQVDLLVRGMCCLRPGLAGISDNIRVYSIVGRFLEHTRIYYFHNDGAEEIYLGSADLMPRNINRRVETLFPVRDPRMLRYLRDTVLETYLSDNVKSREMLPDGSYRRRTPGHAEPLCAQSYLLKLHTAKRRR